jgi:hydroxymethylpyrimidine pyrophosphatase-like HAD family hydrolase
MNVHNIGAVVTDLDGTLLTDDKRVQKRDYDAFVKLVNWVLNVLQQQAEI